MKTFTALLAFAMVASAAANGPFATIVCVSKKCEAEVKKLPTKATLLEVLTCAKPCLKSDDKKTCLAACAKGEAAPLVTCIENNAMACFNAKTSAAVEVAAPATEKFELFKTTFNKTYASDEHEAAARAAFLSNEAYIQETNAKGLSYRFGHNQFSDMTVEDWSAQYVGGFDLNATNPNNMRASAISAEPFVASGSHIPNSIDWVKNGAVTPVKNQAKCGGCWSFSTTGSLEGANFVENKVLVSLSEQELISCDHQDHGCGGGIMDYAYQFVEQKGLCTEKDYGYTSGEGDSGSCKNHCKAAISLRSFKSVSQGDEDDLKAAVAQQPVSVAIEADHRAFQMYSGGVFDGDCGRQLDHAVLVVGYGTDNGKDYWKIKNSWSAKWGEDGYIRISRGTDQCGVADHAVFPTGVSKNNNPAPSPSPGGDCSQDPIEGSVSWFTCLHENMVSCGSHQCCCKEGFQYLGKSCSSCNDEYEML